ncbi:hypothetical protein C5F47_04050 [Nitrosopumilus cobalaminigenes]|uniref:Uncharacterized protein n=1 Tax=Nitrosopumilus cobalaminigenes TaxID=1470066 RepID=A0A7D5RBP5_9ARCH|nr:hypothetical protein [Nitrosopumilus cobalaminigenes]QLH02785.1 hypothetical protein C5F47_04050 [Nitrosopumilus cobalaminigenes]
MKQTSKKHSLLFALPVLAVLVFGSIGTTNVFAEDANNGFIPTTVSSVTTDTLSDVAVESPDRQAEVKFDGKTSGWAIVAGQAFPSSIALDGKAVHQNNGVWKVKSTAEISVGDRENIELDLKGKAVNGKLRLHGTGTLDGGDTFRIILRGHYAPVADSPGTFILDFSTAKVQNMENGLRIPLFQHGPITVEPVVSTVDDLVTDSNVEE